MEGGELAGTERPEGRVHAVATLRAVANVGVAFGAGLAGFALVADTGWAYRMLVVGNVVTYLVSAALIMRLPAYPPTALATVLLLGATVIYTVGDLWHGTAGAALAYDLAAPDALGAYQGVDALLTGLARAAGPALLTWLVLDGGPIGWLALAGLLAGTGLAVPALTRRAVANRAERSPASGQPISSST
ncbi:hypothetical protein [Micromonospora sp. WMMD710]|uniref:hypothetical protein n=1 Tax=Micromonospora sp. WMMD710 TaxID=3016085 RepID=UPI002416F86F|nr:hypothetical protein [Micromonospora sp. WMMD710]MDG4758873.1 hypothetical protein [Micromonospora sp. WMMD710]